MKSYFSSKTMVALAVALAAATGFITQAQDQPMPPPAGASALPPEIDPNSPLAQVVKLAQAGVDESVIKNYVDNTPSAFNLDADKIITLNDLGVPKDIVNEMMNHDKAVYAASVTPPPAATPPPVDTGAPTDYSAPDQPVTVDYFTTTLAPYGTWVDVDGYGRCWRPTVVVYDSGWRPYCDRGHWVYTDCGWYWDSDYSWGSTFHYGRWFHHARFGWCWSPDVEWAPSWVTWRSSDDYCGWAPLPPLAVFRPGFGFFFRGAAVSASFDFGLSVDAFTFVSPDHFCEHHPRRFCVEPARAPDVFRRTTIINNFDVHDRFVVNTGIAASRFHTPDHHPIEPVHVGSLPNAGRQGWRGDSDVRMQHRTQADTGNFRTLNAGAHQADQNTGRTGNGVGQPYNRPNNGGQQPMNHPQQGSPYMTPRQQSGNQNNNNNNNNGWRDHSQNTGFQQESTGHTASTGTGGASAGNTGAGAGATQNHWPVAGANNNTGGGSSGVAMTSREQQQQTALQQRQQEVRTPVVSQPVQTDRRSDQNQNPWPQQNRNVEQPRVQQPQYEQPRVQQPQYEQPRVQQPQVQQPRVQQPQYEQPRVQQPQVEQPRVQQQYTPPPQPAHTESRPEPQQRSEPQSSGGQSQGQSHQDRGSDNNNNNNNGNGNGNGNGGGRNH